MGGGGIHRLRHMLDPPLLSSSSQVQLIFLQSAEFVVSL